MLASMTGFGRASLQTPFGLLIVEIQSVNRKHLDVNLSLPRELVCFEPELKSLILASKITRGQLQIRVSLEMNAEIASICIPHETFLLASKRSWEKLAAALGLPASQITLSFLMEHLPACDYGWKAKAEDWAFLQKAVEQALKEFKRMREQEGRALVGDMTFRLQLLKRNAEQIEHLSAASKEKLKERLAEKIGLQHELHEGLWKEIVLFADRLDVTEEIIRLRAHFKHMEELFSDPEGAIGRKMDFLIQEIGREINTTGSKSMDTTISRLVIDMKSELEKIKEQVQNLE